MAERLRIYRAAGPILLERGVARTGIRDVARASCLSPGGIYHYFRSKADLALYGLHPEALSRACSDAARDLAAAIPDDATPDPAVTIDLFVERNLLMLELVRPALHAAIELGRPELQARLSAAVRDDADDLVTALRSLCPGLFPAAEPAEAIRRVVLGLALDRGILRERARDHLRWLFAEILPAPGDGARAAEERLSRGTAHGRSVTRRG